MLESALSVALQLSIPPETLPLLLVTAGLGVSFLEAFAPGAHFIVLGIALLAAGLVGLVLGPLASPIVLGVLVLVFGSLALYGYRESDIYGGKGTEQTSDSASLRGRTGRVTERVTPTDGEVKLDDGGFNPFYAARSVDGELPVGTEVVVVDPGGGNVVTVESLSSGYDEIDRQLDQGRASRSDDVERADSEGDTEMETERA
ncbi:protease [Haloferax sp. Atlit-6N]|uniref:NfeD family protein n=1 Tax=Haloferax sp. Atlit-6N TaxID=2077205 RepID=UPI000E26CD58|nr:NfeD family protein [Haloferax sp. Atlit-6N]RDZ99083.1 protease [Haloferax sp. Atlit-6N]